MAADLIFDEASATLTIISDNLSLSPAMIVVVEYSGLFEVYAGTPSLRYVFLGRLNEEIAAVIRDVKSAVWIKIDDVSVIDTFEVSAFIIDESLVCAYVLSELRTAWSEYCKKRQLNNQTGDLGKELLTTLMAQLDAMEDVSIFPDYRNFNLFTVSERDGLLNEVARQPAGGLAGLRIRQNMDLFLKDLSLRQ
jgi:hypothetical protein